MTRLGWYALSFLVPPLFSWLYWCCVLRHPALFFPGWVTSASLFTLSFMAFRLQPEAVSAASSAIVALIMWWRSRRRGRKRARKLLGDKSRALRDALVRSMPRWSPRLRPAGSAA